MADVVAKAEIEQEIVTDADESGEVSAQADSGDDSRQDEPRPGHKRMVPLPELQAERRKRQEAQSEIERLRGEAEAYRRQVSVLPAKPEPEPKDEDVWAEGPAKYIKRQMDTVRGQAQAAAQQAKFEAACDISRDWAEDKWPDYAEKEAYWMQHATMADLEMLKQQKNPAKFAYQWAKGRLEPPKSEAEREAEIEARIMARLKDQGIELPAQENVTPIKKPVPRTMASERGSGRDTAQSRNLTAVEAARQITGKRGF